MAAHNPYIAGNPLKDQGAFFGREDIFKDVMQTLRHPDQKAIVLYGQRRIGKTSILLQVAKRLENEGHFSPVYFDLMDQSTASICKVTFKLAQTIATKLNISSPDQALFDEEGIYFKDHFLPNVTQSACDQGIIILFDEFDVMDNPQNDQAGQAFFPYLRACLQELQKVKFVFVIGRRTEELSINTKSTFKGIRSSRVSALDREATEQVIRQSEKENSLTWSTEALDCVWGWTEGHAYFTQLLCSRVWENMADSQNGQAVPTARATDVDKAVPKAIKDGSNAFSWIWDGLPPAERVVMAALAEAQKTDIQEEEITDILQRSGVRMMIRELYVAPEILIDWELLRKVNYGYRFAVPLLRQWVRTNRPLSRVKEELDRMNPLADSLYNTGIGYYQINNIDEASQSLRRALLNNPNHLKARLLLGKILRELGTKVSTDEAVNVLSEAYQYDSSAAFADYLQALLVNAETQPDDEGRMLCYERILNIIPDQPLVLERRSALLRRKAEEALKQQNFELANETLSQLNDIAGVMHVKEMEKEYWFEIGHQAEQLGNFGKAIEAFEKAGSQKRVEVVKASQKQYWISEGEKALQANNFDKAEELFKLANDQSHLEMLQKLRDKQWIQENLSHARKFELDGRWRSAIVTFQKILNRFPDNQESIEGLKYSQNEHNLSIFYDEGQNSLGKGNLVEAKKAFAEVIAIRPEYKDAARILANIVEGVPAKDTPMVAPAQDPAIPVRSTTSSSQVKSAADIPVKQPAANSTTPRADPPRHATMANDNKMPSGLNWDSVLFLGFFVYPFIMLVGYGIFILFSILILHIKVEPINFDSKWPVIIILCISTYLAYRHEKNKVKKG